MKMMTLTCEHDGHEWHRPSQRGRPPRFCPEHAGVQVHPALTSNRTRTPVTRNATIQSVSIDADALKEKLDQMADTYESLFDQANATNDPEVWKKVDRTQNVCLNIIRRLSATKKVLA